MSFYDPCPSLNRWLSKKSDGPTIWSIGKDSGISFKQDAIYVLTFKRNKDDKNTVVVYDLPRNAQGDITTALDTVIRAWDKYTASIDKDHIASTSNPLTTQFDSCTIKGRLPENWDRRNDGIRWITIQSFLNDAVKADEALLSGRDRHSMSTASVKEACIRIKEAINLETVLDFEAAQDREIEVTGMDTSADTVGHQT